MALKALLLIDAVWSDELYSAQEFADFAVRWLCCAKIPIRPYYPCYGCGGGCSVKPRSACACSHGWPMGWGQG